jgi:uncharacterized protein (TIGR03067 family)
MKRMLAPGLVLMLAVGAARGEEARDDPKWQGNWVAETDGKKIEVTFGKDTFTITFEGKHRYKGTFKTDPSKKPGEMDLTIKEGEKFQGDTAYAIYEVQGDTLKWCAHQPGKEGRAKTFPDKEGEDGEYLYLVFKRVK